MSSNPLALSMALLAVAGVVFTGFKIADDWLNYQVLRQAVRAGRVPRGDGRGWIALASLVSSVGQILVWFGFVTIGWLVLSMPTPAPADRLPTNLMILRVLLYMEIVLFAVQVWQLLVRSRVRRPRALTTVGPHESVDVATIQDEAVDAIADAVVDAMPDQKP